MTNCVTINIIQYLHYFLMGMIGLLPLTFYKPLIAITLYIIIPIFLLVSISTNGNCIINAITNSMYGSPSVDYDKFWLINPCNEPETTDSVVPIPFLLLMTIIGLYILCPPSKKIFTFYRMKWYSIMMLIMITIVSIIFSLYKTDETMRDAYPDCAIND